MRSPSLALLTAAAALALFGGFHLEIASGRALDRVVPDDARLQTNTTFAAMAVNRISKSDRPGISPRAAEGRTVVFQHPDLQSTTVAVRMLESVSALRTRPPLKDGKPVVAKQKAKPAVACEGVVSVLTEVARHLDPGRCLT